MLIESCTSFGIIMWTVKRTNEGTGILIMIYLLGSQEGVLENNKQQLRIKRSEEASLVARYHWSSKTSNNFFKPFRAKNSTNRSVSFSRLLNVSTDIWNNEQCFNLTCFVVPCAPASINSPYILLISQHWPSLRYCALPVLK